MIRFPRTPFDAAWEAFGGKPRRWWQRWFSKPTVFGCPECEMPINHEAQRTNIRIENGIIHDGLVERCYVLSCPWCYKVMNIGAVATVDQHFTIARKESNAAIKSLQSLIADMCIHDQARYASDKDYNDAVDHLNARILTALNTERCATLAITQEE